MKGQNDCPKRRGGFIMKRILKTTLKIIWNIWGVFALVSTLVAMFKVIAWPKSYIAEQIRLVNDFRKDFKVEKFG